MNIITCNQHTIQKIIDKFYILFFLLSLCNVQNSTNNSTILEFYCHPRLLAIYPIGQHRSIMWLKSTKSMISRNIGAFSS